MAAPPHRSATPWEKKPAPVGTGPAKPASKATAATPKDEPPEWVPPANRGALRSGQPPANGAKQGAPPSGALCRERLLPHHFADTYSPKDGKLDGRHEGIEVGLRLLASHDLHRVREQAQRHASLIHPGGAMTPVWIETYKESLIDFALVRAICVPDEPKKAFWGAAQEVIVPSILSTGGKLFLYERLTMMIIGESPVTRQATDEEIARLARICSEKKIDEVRDPAQRRRLKRLVSMFLEEVDAALAERSEAG